MSRATQSFPDRFLWGASTAAHQVEGNNVGNDFWALENRAGSPLPERSGDACDSYHRWPEDLDLLAASGLTAYRFSLEWSRIEPSRGQFSRAALAHYRAIIEGCRERGIEPMVTLHHFTLPLWFAEAGGWRAPGAVEDFRSYARAAAAILHDVAWVCTINEPNMVALFDQLLQHQGPTEGPAGALGPPDQQLATALVEAHRAARDVVREHTGAAVGWTIANQVFQAAAPGDEEAVREWGRLREDQFIDAAAGDDFVGVQAYTRTRVGSAGALPVPDGARRTLTDWEYYPAAIGEALRHTARRIPGVPLLVTENGIATADDAERIAYTTEALTGVLDAVADGLDVRGYFHWSLLDNYEWGRYAPTFGLIAVDRETFARRAKPSARWLGRVAAANALTVG